MKDVYYQMAKAEGKIEAVCEQCAGGRAVAFCRQCAEFICSDCERSHKKMKIFSGHVVATVDDHKKGGLKNIPLKEAPPMKCFEHDQVMKMFCFDCNQLICGDCTFIDHNFNFLRKCAPEIRRTLRDSLIPLKKVQADIAGAENSLDTEETKINDQRDEVCKSIERLINELKSLLDLRKSELVEKVTTLAQQKKEALSAQKKGFRVAQLLVEFIERNIESTSDQDLMNIQTQLKDQMEEEEKRHQQLTLELTASADISCYLVSPDFIPRHLGVVFGQSTPPQLLNDNISCEVSSAMDVSVIAPTVISSDVSAQLKSVVDPSVSLQGDVVQKGVGIYSLTFIPQVRGRHDLTVRVKDEEITGSPFRVFVTIPPSQLGQNVREISSSYGPWGIAINDKQQVVVAETSEYKGHGQKVTIMEKGVTKVKRIQCPQFRDPRGVAAGPDGAIYVTDIKAHCLFKFSEDGILLKTIGGFKKPYSHLESTLRF